VSNQPDATTRLQSIAEAIERDRIALCNVTSRRLNDEDDSAEQEILRDCRRELWLATIKLRPEEIITALAESEAMRGRQMTTIDEMRRALDRMRFAYLNKDADCPHDFEKSALAEAARLLGTDPAARAAVEGA